MNTHVDFETAKLLKEKGYRLLPGFESSYPTIAEVVMWLYEKHGIWVTSSPFVRRDVTVIWLYDIFKNNYIIEQLSPSN